MKKSVSSVFCVEDSSTLLASSFTSAFPSWSFAGQPF